MTAAPTGDGDCFLAIGNAVTVFNGFEPTEGALTRLRLGLPILAGFGESATWCHAVELPSAEAAHLFVHSGTTTRGVRLPGGAVVLRVGRTSCPGSPSSCAPFVELRTYPDGVVPPLTYETGTHEFVLLAPHDWEGTSVSAPATAIATAWSLIMALRTNSEQMQRADELAGELVATVARFTEHSDQVARARHALDHDWRSGSSTRTLAEHLGLTEAYLCRAFRYAYRTTISNYVGIVRAARAAGLLWGSREPISEIAALCGFADQSHLTRSITSRFGVSPAQFRRLAPCLGKPRLAQLSFEVAFGGSIALTPH